MCFTNVNEAGIRYRYFMYSTNKCTDFNKNISKKKIKSFLPVETEITVTKVFITANMKNSKSHCKQEVDVR
jgi:hypothetical protein